MGERVLPTNGSQFSLAAFSKKAAKNRLLVLYWEVHLNLLVKHKEYYTFPTSNMEKIAQWHAI